VSRIDLHVHSTASDGKFSPQALIKKAAALGMTYMALSDHDTVDGIIPALQAVRAFPKLKVIPAVEISTDTSAGEVHVLGYFIDYTSTELTEALDRFKNSRLRRAQAMIARLRDTGVNIEWERVQEIAGAGSVGRPHIAQAMMEKKYIESFIEAFDKYIGYGCPAYVERDKMTPVEAVELIVRSRGLPVLAHPNTVTNPEKMVISLKKAGLAGVEAYYKDYDAEATALLVNMADRHNLITTGGTDYHGIDDETEVMLGGVDVPMEAVEQLTAIADKRVLKLADFSIV
jgi:predicted metal-dependent phosphoesterase TrpH